MAAVDRAPITPFTIPVTTTFEVNGQAGIVAIVAIVAYGTAVSL